METMAVVPVATSRGSHGLLLQTGLVGIGGAGPGWCCPCGVQGRLPRLGTLAWCQGSWLPALAAPRALLLGSRSGGLGASARCRCCAVSKLLVAAEQHRQFSTIRIRNAQS